MRRTVWAWARVLGGGGLLALLAWRLGTGAFLDGLHVINGWILLAACALGLLTTVLSACRWCLVARGLGIRLPLRTAVADYYGSLFLNAALPGGVLGDVHRAVRHGRDVGDVGRGVRAVVVERSAGQVVVFAVGLAVLLEHPARLLSTARSALIGLAGSERTVAEVAALIAALVAAPGVLALGAWAWMRWRRRAAAGPGTLRRRVSELRLGLIGRQNWPVILILSALVLAGHLTAFLIAARAAGSVAPIGRLVPLMLLALLAMMLPVNIGGWGPREGVTAWAFGAAGLSATLGLTIAVVYGLLALVASLPGAGVLVARWIIRLRAARAHRELLLDSLSDRAPDAAIGTVPEALPEATLEPVSA